MSMLDINDKELKDAVNFTLDYYENMKKNFVNVGSETIKDCGIEGDGKDRIVKLANSFEESIQNPLEDYNNLVESMKTYIKDLTGFNAEDYFAMHRKTADEVSSSANTKTRESRFKR